MYIQAIIHIFLSLLVDHICSKRSDEVKLISDYFKMNEMSPSMVTALLCWSSEDKIYLRTELQNSNFIRINILSNFNYIPEYKDYEYSFYLLDFNCNGSVTALSKANERDLFASPYRWLILTKDDGNLIEPFNIFLDSKVCVAQEISDGQYLLDYIYKIGNESGIVERNRIGVWSRTEKRFQRFVLSRERKNVRKTLITFSTTMTSNDTVNHLTDGRDPHIDSFVKVNYVLVHILIEYMNGSAFYYIRDSYGYKGSETVFYTGVLGDLQQKRADLSGSLLFMTSDRIDMLDFLSMTTKTTARFIFRQPPLSYVSNIFTLPFRITVWIACLCLVIFAAILLYVAVHWEARKNADGMDDSFSSVVLVTIGAVCQQGTTHEPKSYSGRIVLIVTFVAVMFLYVSYSANIVALLQSTTNSIRTLEDLLHSRLGMGCDDLAYWRYYFTKAKDPVRKAVYEKKVAPKGKKSNFLPLREGVKRVRNGFFAFHMEKGPGYKIIKDTFYEDEKCGLEEIDFLNIANAWLPARKNSTYKEIFKIGLRKIAEYGIQSREVRRIYTSKPECLSKGSSFISVGLLDSYGAFVVFLVGVLLSLLVLLVEIIAHKEALRQYKFQLKNINNNTTKKNGF